MGAPGSQASTPSSSLHFSDCQYHYPLNITMVIFKQHKTTTIEAISLECQFHRDGFIYGARRFFLGFLRYPGLGNKLLDAIYFQHNHQVANFGDQPSGISSASGLPNACHDIRVVLFRPHICLRDASRLHRDGTAK